MKAKTAKPNSINAATRCRHLTANGRCRTPAFDSATNLCFDHARKALQARQDSDFARYLTRESSGFQTAQGINHSLADLYTLLAHGHISPAAPPSSPTSPASSSAASPQSTKTLAPMPVDPSTCSTQR
jgi:hypothetical protein